MSGFSPTANATLYSNIVSIIGCQLSGPPSIDKPLSTEGRGHKYRLVTELPLRSNLLPPDLFALFKH